MQSCGSNTQGSLTWRNPFQPYGSGQVKDCKCLQNPQLRKFPIPHNSCQFFLFLVLTGPYKTYCDQPTCTRLGEHKHSTTMDPLPQTSCCLRAGPSAQGAKKPEIHFYSLLNNLLRHSRGFMGVGAAGLEANVVGK